MRSVTSRVSVPLTATVALLWLGCGDDLDAEPSSTDTIAPDSLPPTDTDTDTVVPTETGVPPQDSAAPPRSILTEQGTITCADPVPPLTIRYDQTTIRRVPAQTAHLEGAGAAAADFDGDGLLDLVTVHQSEVLLFINQADWLSIQPRVLLTQADTTDVTGLFGASAADFDDDGDLDILVTGRGTPNYLLRNDGSAQFEDITDTTALAAMPSTHHSTSSTWHDIDQDGDLDLFIGGHGYVDEASVIREFEPGEPSWLFRNRGDGSFEDIRDLLPPEVHAGYTFVAGWLDADADGDDDMYVVNDFGGNQAPCQLVWNDQGTFRLDDGSAGLNAMVSGMGLAIGDFNRDGLEELAVPAWRNHVFFERNNGTWFDVSNLVGFRTFPPQTVGWGSEFVDVDNDGLLDLATAFGYLSTGFGDENGIHQEDAMFIQVQDGQFDDQARSQAFNDIGPHRSILPADLNRDGALDFVKVSLDGNILFYMSRCDANAWLTVHLQQPAPNTQAIGATVRATIDGTTWLRRLRAGGTGYATGGPPELHFGLGTHEVIDELEVTWPDGSVESWRDISTRQAVVITRQAALD